MLDASMPNRLPVSLEGLQERILLKAELMHSNAQLRNFTPLRDRLVASGKDANAVFRQIESRRDDLYAELKKFPLDPWPRVSRGVPYGPNTEFILSLPVAPVRFLSPGNSPWFGYSGQVQMGAPSEGVNVSPEGTIGSIYAFPAQGAFFQFGAKLAAAPVQGNPKTFFWLHSWIYLIPFPAPSSSSTLTYSLQVAAEVATVTANGDTTLCVFASVGETANFTGQQVVVNKLDSWPLVADFYQSAQEVESGSEVQRSFAVGGGQTPAVALAVGVVMALENGTEIELDDSVSFIFPGSKIHGLGVVDFRYDPDPPVLHQ